MKLLVAIVGFAATVVPLSLTVYGSFYVRPSAVMSESPDGLRLPFRIWNEHFPTLYRLTPSCLIETMDVDTATVTHLYAEDEEVRYTRTTSDMPYQASALLFFCYLDDIGAGQTLKRVHHLTLALKMTYELHIVPGWPWRYEAVFPFSTLDAKRWMGGRRIN
jgi:hypothetical protein